MDIDGDGNLDLVAGNSPGEIWFFKNLGTKTEPKLAPGVKFKADGKEIVGASATVQIVNNEMKTTPAPADAVSGVYSKIHVTDWDGDGLLDLLVGQQSPKGAGSEIVFYRNTGTATAPKFAAPLVVDLGLRPALDRMSPYVVDWDGDGKKDMLIGTDDGKIFFLRNTGSNAKPVFAAPEEVKLPGLDTCIRTRFTVVDWNNRGKLDLLVGTYYYNAGPDKKASGGKVWLFRRK